LAEKPLGVILNMPLFILRYHGTAVMKEHSWAYLVPYPFVAIGVSSARRICQKVTSSFVGLQSAIAGDSRPG
jgi:hypothetical protein